MTTNNDQQNNEQRLEKDLRGLRKIELDPKEKGVLFAKLLQYTKLHPAPEASGIFATLFLKVKALFVSSK